MKLSTKKLNVVLSVLVAVLLALVLFLSWRISFQKNVLTSKSIDKTINLALEQQKATKQLYTYRAPQQGYEITFDPNIWRESGTTHLTEDKNASEIILALREQYGYGRIQFISNNFGNNTSVVIYKEREINKDTKLDDLDLYAGREIKRLEGDYKRDPQTFEKLVNKEKITLNGRNMYKLTLSKVNRYTGEEKKYYEYIGLGEHQVVKLPKDLEETDFLTSFTIIAHYADIANSKNLVENLIGSFKFFPSEIGNLNQYVYMDDVNKAVKGVSTTKPEITKLDEVQLVELVKPSVVNIFTAACHKIIINSQETAKYLKPEYAFCSAGTGSGFIINKDGYVATNGHVAKIYPEEALVMNLTDPQLSPFLVDLTKELVYSTKNIELSDAEAKQAVDTFTLNPEGLNSIMEVLYEFMDKKMLTIKETGTKYYIKLGNDPFDINMEKVDSGDYLNVITTGPTVMEASLVGYDFPNMFSVEAIINQKKPSGSDVAILKATNPQTLTFPTLKLGSSQTLKEGSQIIVIGFPGLVSGEDSLVGGPNTLIDYKTSAAKPTITRGIVSAIKTDVDGKTLIQTDASIDHGNSGGPAFNSQGEVVGIATYGISSGSGNYNLLRSMEDLKALIAKNSVTVDSSTTYTNWQTGLENFWNQKYHKSLSLFKTVKTSYPIHPTVDTFITDANTAIANGEDKDLSGIFIIIGSAVFILILGGGIIIVFKKRHLSTPPVTGSSNVINTTTDNTKMAEAVRFIVSARKAGGNDLQIRQSLMQAGWNQATIDSLFKYAQTPMTV